MSYLIRPLRGAIPVPLTSLPCAEPSWTLSESLTHHDPLRTLPLTSLADWVGECFPEYCMPPKQKSGREPVGDTKRADEEWRIPRFTFPLLCVHLISPQLSWVPSPFLSPSMD